MQNRITSLFKIQYPLIQAGMVWCSGWELAAAVSNAGGLGIIGSSSMDADTLAIHIRKARQATDRPFAVNVPIRFSRAEENIRTIIKEGVTIVFTSAGNPATYTPVLQKAGIKVVHVVSNLKFALKCEEVGVDAIVAEGVEAGGHNGREETTTLTLLPLIRKHVRLPLIAAGGIGSGRAMLACMALGADGVQMGSRFVASAESSAHQAFKNKVVEIKDGQTRLSLKKLAPVRMIRNEFCERVEKA
ncbi:MAG TPA: nitronate monooxygenase, partial [Bacteroidales bacterium]|nr:nitronate monooxygenase [Bacteroidales bacterium]